MSSFATLGRYDLLEMSDDTSFEVTFRFSIFNERGRVIRLVRPLCRPNRNLVELIGIEPTTSGLQSQRSPN